ncbi:MAG: transglutaminase family protein [Ilumatobacteraceae bacterium]|nr:transglutaminase family protein [Ilumatobacteraceae bacterium]
MTDDRTQMGDRQVEARIGATVTAPADLAVSIAVAAGVPTSHERLSIRLDGVEVAVSEIVTEHGGRIHLISDLHPGRLDIDYAATVDGVADEAKVSAYDTCRYMRPSRYCQSDELGPFARAEFAGLSDDELLPAISSWVGANLLYVPGSSRPTDGAVATLLAREGVCRDYAHLTTALLRANSVPARVVSVYAPGLDPMDFHAVTEVCVGGAWTVVDPTCLAPRSSMVRIATGADATDTAFMSTLRGQVDLDEMQVTAYVTDALPVDDVFEQATIG